MYQSVMSTFHFKTLLFSTILLHSRNFTNVFIYSQGLLAISCYFCSLFFLFFFCFIFCLACSLLFCYWLYFWFFWLWLVYLYEDGLGLSRRSWLSRSLAVWKKKRRPSSTSKSRGGNGQGDSCSNLEEVVCISQNANTLEKVLNLFPSSDE